MFNFNEPRYEKVVNDAIALRPQIEAAVDKICEEGYSNIFFIGCGGTYAHSLPMKFWLDKVSDIDTYSVIAAEFMAAPPQRNSQKILFVYSLQEAEIQRKLFRQRSSVKTQAQEHLSMYPMTIHRFANMPIINSSALQKTIVCVKQFIHT